MLFGPYSDAFVNPTAGWIVLGFFWFAIIFIAFVFVTLIVDIFKKGDK